MKYLNLCSAIGLVLLLACNKANEPINLTSPSGLTIANSSAELKQLVKKTISKDFNELSSLAITQVEFYEQADKSIAVIHYSVAKKSYQNLVYVFNSPPGYNANSNEEFIPPPGGFLFKCTSSACYCSVNITRNAAGQVETFECGGCQSCHFEQTSN